MLCRRVASSTTDSSSSRHLRLARAPSSLRISSSHSCARSRFSWRYTCCSAASSASMASVASSHPPAGLRFLVCPAPSHASSQPNRSVHRRERCASSPSSRTSPPLLSCSGLYCSGEETYSSGSSRRHCSTSKQSHSSSSDASSVEANGDAAMCGRRSSSERMSAISSFRSASPFSSERKLRASSLSMSADSRSTPSRSEPSTHSSSSFIEISAETAAPAAAGRLAGAIKPSARA
mmetsp:Transcript_41220/g.99982  ORF Transcript_41220/g.99982 Transcript_41220/m.99982 type:complete len:235 (+) Transcript_41220:2440-3144(+)